ncbi:MAG: glycosyltransferase family 2 protein [Clostridiales bacterium]|nr:glycosyltransferase family 2 protein [Clostridiales bacterium]
MKKTINVLIACYNEEENVVPLTEALTKIFNEQLSAYDYHITFIDNCSEDNTRPLLRELCEKDKHVRAIFNVRNFGHIRSPFHGMQQSLDGDCTILMCADFQDPPELLPRLVELWEEGYLVVYGKKTRSKESKLMYALRSMYYKEMKKASDVEQISQFTGFGLYDKSFVELLAKIDDPYPYMRGLVAEFAGKKIALEYTQPKRRAGKTKNNMKTLYDMGMLGVTSYTKKYLRLATILGVVFAGLSCLGLLTTLILNLCTNLPISYMTYLVEGLFLFNSIILFFIGLSGEYIMFINQRSMRRPLVSEELRLNFDTEEQK